MADLENEVLTGEVEEVTTNTETEVTEDSGIGGLGIAIAGLAILGAVAAGKAVYTGGKKLIGKAKAKLDEKNDPVEQFEEVEDTEAEFAEETESKKEA